MFPMFAAILGFHGMLNQVQYHQAFVEQKDNSEVAGGFQGKKSNPFLVFDMLIPALHFPLTTSYLPFVLRTVQFGQPL